MTPHPVIAWRRVRAIVAHTQVATTAGTRMKMDGQRTLVSTPSIPAENARVNSQK